MTTPESSLAVFDSLLAEVTVAVAPILALKVTDAESEQSARMAGGQVAALLKEVENRRKEYLAPLKARTDAINAAAKKVVEVLSSPEGHVRSQLNAYATEIAKKRTEELRIQREKEEAARREAQERIRKERAELAAKQEAERRDREAEIEAKRAMEESAAAEQAQAAEFFGAGEEAKEREATERKRAEEDARRAQEELQTRLERERIAEQARIQREEEERLVAEEIDRKSIEDQKVKNGRTQVVVTVVDPWAIPRDLCRPPEVIVAMATAAYKAGRKEIPGLLITEEARVSLRAELSGRKLA